MSVSDQEYISIKIPVPERFREIFGDPYYAENTTENTITKTLVPSYSVIMVFAFAAKTTFHSNGREIVVEKCQMFGPIKQAFDYSLYKGAQLLVIGFRGDAFYRFFGSAHIESEVPVNPDEILGESYFTALWREMNALKTIEERVGCLIRFCEPYLDKRNQLVTEISHFYDQNMDPIKSLAFKENQTERNIQLLHKKYLGYSAKELNRFHRFVKAVGFIRKIASSHSKVDWQDVVVACGYYDQSQLIRDFNHYLDLTPKKYLKFQRDICG